MIQFVIATVLMFVLMFGIGFILNMLLKTSWLPIYVYVIVVLIFLYTHRDPGSIWNMFSGYTYIDWTTGLGGLVGAYLSGKTIQMLRVKGYKMF